MTRFIALLLLLIAPFAGTTAQGRSDLDRLSETSAYTSPEESPSPVGGEDALACGDPGSPPCPPPDAPPVPVDGGLSLLALAGAGYAARRLRRARAEGA
ncbi:MAG TPA: hypothetical protein VF594_09065 [Rubricoccaceae bacterium]|jgi:hypothetical protein